MIQPHETMKPNADNNEKTSQDSSSLDVVNELEDVIAHEVQRDGLGSSDDQLDVSVIVPTYREAENLPILIPQVCKALQDAGLNGEVIIVDDDSRDGTVEVCAELAKSHPIRLETRTTERGLSTAVIHGFRHARGKYLICMDADLSHPPERVPELVRQLVEENADFVIGSRYVKGGSTDGDWGLFRKLNSLVATWLARPLTKTSDPMAGFFGLSKNSFASAAELDPIGYKIGLELMVKCGCSNVREIPIHFSDRLHGESKLSLKEQLNYLRHLKRLMEFKYGHLATSTQFAAVGLSGMAIDLATFSAGQQWLNLSTAAARAMGIWLAMTWNFILNRNITFGRKVDQSQSWSIQYIQFCGSCLLGGLLNFGTSIGLIESGGFFAEYPLVAAMIGVATGFGLNYVLSSEWVFRKKNEK